MRKLTDFDYMLSSYINEEDKLEQLRLPFTKTFTIEYIKNNMKIDNFVVGKKNKSSFCYRLEFELDKLGSMKGSNSKKFGIYYSQQKQDYVVTKAWQRNNVNQSFTDLKAAIVKIIDLGKKDNTSKEIDAIPLSDIFKYKILSVYYPYKYLNIFAKEPLTYFLSQFYQTKDLKNMSIYELQKMLIDMKRKDKALKNWSNIEYGNYLYYLFPNAKKLNSSDYPNRLKHQSYDIETPQIPEDKEYSYKEIYNNPIIITESITHFLDSSKKRRHQEHNKAKIDYVTKEQKNIKLGMIGEEIVFNSEVKRLKDFNNLNVEWESKVDDSLGYDILSYELDGTPRYIEVKTTKGNRSNSFSFYISHNELEKSKVLKNYWIYQVFFSVGQQPVISLLEDPFNAKDIKMTALNYLVNVQVKRED